MHPIIRPDKIPSSAIHTTSDNGTNIYPLWRRCIIVFQTLALLLVAHDRIDHLAPRA
jgi:hypothetical protein